MSDKKELVSASPKVRKLAREFGADIYQIQGSQREGRVSEEDVKSFKPRRKAKKIIHRRMFGKKRRPNYSSIRLYQNLCRPN